MRGSPREPSALVRSERERAPGPITAHPRPSRSSSRLLSRRGSSLSFSLFFRSNAHAFRPDSSIILGRQMTRPPKSNERERGCRRARLVKHFARVRSLLSLFSRFMAPSFRDVGAIPPRTRFAEFHRYWISEIVDGIAALEGLVAPRYLQYLHAGNRSLVNQRYLFFFFF